MSDATKDELPYESYQIYDKIFKRILMLSSTTVINMINECFHTNYPLDSEIQYNMTEHVNDELKRTLADAILTVNGIHSYHFEAQISWDKHIVVRMFEYGYNHSMKHLSDLEDIYFPEPLIIYLDENTANIPDYQTLHIHFGARDCYCYRVPVLKYLAVEPDDPARKKMVALVPFQLLRLRKTLQKSRTPENMDALKELILHDIIGSIKENERVGNITKKDARILLNLTGRLYQHIYEKYRELEEGGYSVMIEEALVLDIDMIEYEHNQRLDAMQREIDEAKIAIEREKEEAERKKEEVERQKEEAERQKAAAEQEKIKAEKEREIVRQENFKLKKALKLLAQQNPGEEVYKLMGITREELDQLINEPPHVV